MEICKNCPHKIPDVLKERMPGNECMEDEYYYCQLCGFIRSTGIAELLYEEEHKPKMETLKPDYIDDEALVTMWMLEDEGAFSDEGIMEGCHSGYFDSKCEVEDIIAEFEEMAFVGKCIRLARERMGITKEEFAKRLQLPVSIINNLEMGEYINYDIDREFKENIIVEHIYPVKIADNITEKKEVTEENWWKFAKDYEIKDEVMGYLCYVFNPLISKKYINRHNTYNNLTNENSDELPF